MEQARKRRDECQQRVLIVVVSYNTRALLRRCLLSVAGQAAALDSRVVVVDNASTDGSPDLVRREFPAVELLALDQNIGFGRANNLAVAVAGSSDYVLLLNSDAELPARGLGSLLSFADARPDVDVVAPRLHDAAGLVERSCTRLPRLSLRFFEALGLHKVFRGRGLAYHPWPAAAAFRVEQATAACLLIRMPTWDRIGGFDETFFMYYEDTDLCWRLGQKGATIMYWPDVSVLHHGGASSGEPAGRVAHHLRGQTIAYCRWHGRAAAAVVQVLEGLYTLLYTFQLLPLVIVQSDPRMAARLATNLATLRWLATGRWLGPIMAHRIGRLDHAQPRPQVSILAATVGNGGQAAS